MSPLSSDVHKVLAGEKQPKLKNRELRSLFFSPFQFVFFIWVQKHAVQKLRSATNH